MEIMTYSNQALLNGEAKVNTELKIESSSRLPKLNINVSEPVLVYQVGRSKELLPTIDINNYLTKLAIVVTLAQESNLKKFMRRRPKSLIKLEV